MSFGAQAGPTSGIGDLADVDPGIGHSGTSRPGLVSADVRLENPVPPQFFVRDPDGNRFLIVQPG